jgi:hypothetical protein
MKFTQHYTRDEARALLPEVKKWLERLGVLRDELEKYEERLKPMMQRGEDLGGSMVNDWVRALGEIQVLLMQFQRREIQIKDLDRGLIDFPAVLAGREVFLCWEMGEEDIEFYHELDSGYAGREPL